MYEARLDGIEEAIRGAGFREAPVSVALHRYVEAIIKVNRRWPVEPVRMFAEPAIRERRNRAAATVEAFLRRATDEGLLRPGLPAEWAGDVLGRLLHLAAWEELNAARTADLLVAWFLRGFGTG